MKTINFWSPIDGDEIENPNILMIRILVLYVGKEFWSAGAGEAAVYYKDTESNTNSELLIRYNDEVSS
jgi:hypothetical protein